MDLPAYAIAFIVVACLLVAFGAYKLVMWYRQQNNVEAHSLSPDSDNPQGNNSSLQVQDSDNTSAERHSPSPPPQLQRLDPLNNNPPWTIRSQNLTQQLADAIYNLRSAQHLPGTDDELRMRAYDDATQYVSDTNGDPEFVYSEIAQSNRMANEAWARPFDDRVKDVLHYKHPNGNEVSKHELDDARRHVLENLTPRLPKTRHSL